jgi:membrane-bound metal-dependent hydrolase YbcI (DUF457 family)
LPFTAYHMAPGLAAKAVLRGNFSLVVFGCAQVIMDVEPLVARLNGTGNYHGATHNLAGATVIGAAAAVTGKYLVDAGAILLRRGERPRRRMLWSVAFLSAFFGSFSHVILDGLVHPDVAPWSPLSRSNQLLGLVSESSLKTICIWTGVIGAVAYVTVVLVGAARRKRTQRSAGER